VIFSSFTVEQEPDQLFEVLAQCLLTAVDRDALSGWGAVVHIMYVILICSLLPSLTNSCDAVQYQRGHYNEIHERTTGLVYARNNKTHKTVTVTVVLFLLTMNNTL
jgi:hypothetical protein